MKIKDLRKWLKKNKIIFIGGLIGGLIGLLIFYFLIIFPSIWTKDSLISILLIPLFPIALIFDLFFGCWVLNGIIKIDCTVYPFLVFLFVPFVYCLIGILLGKMMQNIMDKK